MPSSAADRVWQTAGIPALLRAFGIPALHTHGAQPAVAITVIPRLEAVAVGDFGERMESRMTIQCAVSTGATVGDTFSITPDPTVDNPTPTPMIWRAAQLIADNGLMRTFAVIQDS